ncbi:MAG: type IV pilin protein [Leptothrix ochracea]|uniref:type IV pilin protein n=1 Tax=Leptothrix ochracea TaxID=735331 RepID=UPI0034E282F1
MHGHHTHRTHHIPRGWTLLELVVVCGLIALLSTLALPSYRDHVLRSRRMEALSALMQIEQAQERRRSFQPSYTDILGAGGLDLPATTPNGLYQFNLSTVVGTESSAYSITAIAQGAQADDSPCQRLGVTLSAGSRQMVSGPDAQLSNTAAINRRCWGQP